MPSTKKAKQNQGKSIPTRNASKGTKNVSKPKSIPTRLKKPGTALAELVEMVNLVPREVELPELEPSLMLKENEPVLLAFIERLPEKLKAHLIKVYQEDPFAVFKKIGTWGSPMPEGLAAELNNPQLMAHYARLLTWREYNEIKKAREMFRALIPVIQSEEIKYLRECEHCGKIFFAGRKDKKGCSAPCLNQIRKKRWKDQFDAGNPSYHK